MQQSEMRARFDEHKDERDMTKVLKIVEAAEQYYEDHKHPQQMYCMCRCL